MSSEYVGNMAYGYDGVGSFHVNIIIRLKIWVNVEITYVCLITVILVPIDSSW